MSAVKRFVKRFIPARMMAHRTWHLAQRVEAEYASLTTEEAFSRIYKKQMWGSGVDGFSSGDGSYNPSVVDAYLQALSEFLSSENNCVVVDLGCGDFNIGRRMHTLCKHYVACDIVSELIERNRQLFPGVDFRKINIIEDDLPLGDVALIRQVFQHLSNAEIAKVLPKLSRYGKVVVTEHLPIAPFTPNLDKPHGPTIRDRVDSGIVLTAPPFSFRPARERVLCNIRVSGGAITTTLYELRGSTS